VNQAIVLADPDGYVSGSAAPLANKCAAAFALPRIQHGGGKERIGSALHDHYRDRAVMPIDDAMRRLPEIAVSYELDEKETSIFISRARHFEFMPAPGALAEVALGLYEDGHVEIVRGGKGRYTGRPGLRIATRIDLFWAEPKPLYRDGDRVLCPPESVLWAADYKTGAQVYVDPVERNKQALAAAVLAGLWTGARHVAPAIIFPNKGHGDWDVPEAPMDRAAVEAGRDELLALAARVNRARGAVARGEPVPYVTGPWCTYCDAEPYCAAKTAALRRLLDDTAPLSAVMLTPEQARRLADMLPSIKRLHDAGKRALQRYEQATAGPIDMRDGSFFGWYEHIEKVLSVPIALPIVQAHVGKDLAPMALDITMSEKAIGRAVTALHAAKGVTRQHAPTMRAIMGQIQRAGGFVETKEMWFGRFRPKKGEAEIPAAAPAFEIVAQDDTVDGDIDEKDAQG
jgi:hypothetical protein